MSSLAIRHQIRPSLFFLSTCFGCLIGIGYILFYKLFFNLTDNLLWLGMLAALLIWVIIRLSLKPVTARIAVFVLGTLLFFIFAYFIPQENLRRFNISAMVLLTKSHLNLYFFIGILLLIISGFDAILTSRHLNKLFIIQLLTYFIVERYFPNYLSSYFFVLWAPLSGSVLIETAFLVYKEIVPRK